MSPVVYEIDTWPWLAGLGVKSLADVPGEVWDGVAAPGIDTVWLMGVWERSPAGTAIFRDRLPATPPEEIAGSPYCIRQYRADDHLGGPEGLAHARAELRKRGVKLFLDYVPNHVAPDHRAVEEHPDWFVRDNGVVVNGRDPFFPPWPDVLQLNAFAPGMRDATVEALSAIADQCDGIRCDMAMLLVNEIFSRTWGHLAGPAPAEEFWPSVIGRLRERHPDVVLVAEAYWDTEWLLQQHGFDHCYDKRLYDRLVHEDAASIREHLGAGRDYQDRLIRFLENHDEPRAAATFAAGRARAAAVVVATLPGATLWHDGQFEGRRTHLPVFLARYPVEPFDHGLHDFYRAVVAAAAEVRQGRWRLLATAGWPDNRSHQDLLAWAWDDAVVVVNFADHPSQGRIFLPWPDLPGRAWRLTDRLDGRVFERSGAELADAGLFIDLPPWGTHVLVSE
ncbi:alpha-amylase [Actinoplanes sp. HUAS TT8]|uniref:alpha-amylase n=1 Tax=Actinoplanes sp. HUAS TT8 TaxID=3447453 RepID=UPI003F52878A